ncbi:MAG: hypothetical protein F2612_03860 [Actinobacteria bacterium]|nr:hypothetical protein [Actinomycetota bacterium]
MITIPSCPRLRTSAQTHILRAIWPPCAQAITEDPIAVVHVPVRIPNGFHGNWIAD